jgi:hypothetical protein
MTINTDMVFKLGWMVANIKETINRVKKMVKVNMYGKMEVIIMEIG